MLLKDTTLTKKEWIGIIKSLEYITFFVTGSFLSKEEAIAKINSYKDDKVELYHFEGVERRAK